MKKMLVVGFVLVVNYCIAQLPTKEGKVFYEHIDSCSLTKDQLYIKTKLWLANTFHDSKSVIEVDDKENGMIVGKGNFKFSYTYSLVTVYSGCDFTIKIDLKDNKYRIQIYNLLFYSQQYPLSTMAMEEINDKPNLKTSKKIMPEVDKGVNAIITDFKINISKPADTF